MIIYKTTNLINNKIYIGYDTKNNPDYLGSGIYYKRAEKKYGKENFRKSIIDFSNDFKELCLKEIFWINFYDARNPQIGYNILPGGEGWHGPHSEETRKKMGVSKKGNKNGLGYRHSIEFKQRRCGEGNPMFGVHRKGENAPMYGKHHSEETKQKRRGQNNPMSKTNRDKRQLQKELGLR